MLAMNSCPRFIRAIATGLTKQGERCGGGDEEAEKGTSGRRMWSGQEGSASCVRFQEFHCFAKWNSRIPLGRGAL